MPSAKNQKKDESFSCNWRPCGDSEPCTVLLGFIVLFCGLVIICMPVIQLYAGGEMLAWTAERVLITLGKTDAVINHRVDQALAKTRLKYERNLDQFRAVQSVIKDMIPLDETRKAQRVVTLEFLAASIQGWEQATDDLSMPYQTKPRGECAAGDATCTTAGPPPA